MRLKKKKEKKEKKRRNGSHEINTKKRKSEIARYTFGNAFETAAAQNNVRIRIEYYNSTCFETARG